MSYSAEANGTLKIKKENIVAAIEAAGHDVDDEEELTSEKINEYFEDDGFSMILDNEGNIAKTRFYYNDFDADEVLEFLENIAPYVEDGSFISFQGEDGDCWDYDFNDGSVSGGPNDDW